MLKPLALATAMACLAQPVMADTENGSGKTLLQNVNDGIPVRFEYELEATAWLLFIPVTGKATLNTDLNADGRYEISSRVRTTGLADVFVDYDLRLGATGYVDDSGLETFSYVSQNNDGKKNRRVEMTYGEDDFEMTATPSFGNLGEPPATAEQALAAHDPLSALIHHAIAPIPEGGNPCGGPLKIFDGRQLTHLHLELAKAVNVKTKAYEGPAYECHVRMDRVAGYDADEINNDTLTGIDGPLKMWVAPLPNGTNPIVKIQADTDRIGKVTLQVSRLRFSPIAGE